MVALQRSMAATVAVAAAADRGFCHTRWDQVPVYRPDGTEPHAVILQLLLSVQSARTGGAT